MREAGRGAFGREDAKRLKDLAKSSIGQESAPLEFQFRQLIVQVKFTKGQLHCLAVD